MSEAIMRTCPMCSGEHDASFTFGGVPVMACPEVPDGTPLITFAGITSRTRPTLNPLTTKVGGRVPTVAEILDMVERKMKLPGGGFPPDLEVLEMSILHADAIVAAFIHETPPHALSETTWTCERGCGYEGNAPDSNVCEVCKRGRGD